MTNTFQGAALFSADEIKVAMGNFELARTESEYQVEKAINKTKKDKYTYGWLFKKEKSMYLKMENDCCFMTGSYWNYGEWLFDNGYLTEKQYKASIKTVKQSSMCHDINYLSSNGTRPAYLNPDQAAFVNEWGGDKNERD